MNEPGRISLKSRLESIEERIRRACDRVGRRRESVRLIAVTKTHPVDTIQALIDLGVRDIGESRVQELEHKAPLLHGEYVLHLIGHLQTNKVGKVLPLVKWIQSIDSDRLVSRIENIQAAGRKTEALVEVNTSGEASKSGCAPSECGALCERVAASSALTLKGLMTIGPLNAGEDGIRGAFQLLRGLAEKCRTAGFVSGTPELSMGMSNDFEWAIEEGSTMVRIGTALIGERDYAAY